MKTSKPLTYFLLFLAALIGGGGLLIFMLFLFRGSFNIVDLGLTTSQVLIFNVFLCLLFSPNTALWPENHSAPGQGTQLVITLFTPEGEDGSVELISSRSFDLLHSH